MNKEDIRNEISSLNDVVTEHSRKHSEDGGICYPFMAGYMMSFCASLLEDLELTQAQLDKVASRVEYHKDAFFKQTAEE